MPIPAIPQRGQQHESDEEYADDADKANVGANDVMKMRTTIEEVDGDKGTDESLDDNYIVGDDY